MRATRSLGKNEVALFYLMAAVLLFGSLSNLVPGVIAWRAANNARSWMRASGVVTSLSYQTDGKTRGDEPYLVQITYNFTATNGLPYTGTTVFPGNTTITRYSETEVMRFEKTCATGALVTVYYNPQSPGDCALAPQMRDGDKDELEFGLLGTSIAILWFAVAFIRQRYKVLSPPAAAQPSP